ncbi:class I SAM-dependent methyltransferase [Allohahella marinimesophila]|uniref:Class I SAM-dependent methyltransferase n=1 Tax=Allohahella marinimesophila TaxID=1054972 RepID=A0ABP7NGS1_9GAMM
MSVSSIAPEEQPEISNRTTVDRSADSGLYADLSRYYDCFCADVDYAQQCAFTDRLFRAFGESRGQDLLDLACGTGQHLSHMAAKGFAVSGLDNSPAMLEAAGRRCPSATLILQDLANFDFTRRFDLITCFLYSMHYSHPSASLQRTLRLAFEALRPGGVLVFDLADKAGVAQRDAVSRAEQDGVRFEFRSGWRYRGEGEDLDLLVSINRMADPARGIEAAQWNDRHTMTAIAITTVEACMKQIGFEVRILERDFSLMQAWTGRSYNVLFAGVRPLA